MVWQSYLRLRLQLEKEKKKKRTEDAIKNKAYAFTDYAQRTANPLDDST